MKHKHPENSLHWRLMQDVGLSRAQADVALELFLDWAQTNFDGCRPPGQILRTVVAADEPAGKPICHCRTIEVKLSIDHPYDIDILHQHGTVACRRAKVYRLSWQAYEQGGLLSYEDLSSMLSLDRATIKRIVAELRCWGLFVPTRGALKDMGRAPSHKEQICRLLCRGYLWTEISAMTGHLESSIERYALDFGRVIALCDEGAAPNDIRIVCNLGEQTVKTYINLYIEHNTDEFRPHLDKLNRRFESGKGSVGPGQYPGSRKRHNGTERLEKQTFSHALSQLLQQYMSVTDPVAHFISEKVLQLGEAVFVNGQRLRPGQTVLLVDSAESAPKYSGHNGGDRPLVPVILSPWTEDKFGIWLSSRPMVEKRAIIGDMLAREAQRQGGTMTVQLLGMLLGSSSSVMANNLSQLRKQQQEPTPIKGITEDTGATLTHKEPICELEEEGYTPPEISQVSLHTPPSRDRYLKGKLQVETLTRILGQIPDEVRAARFLGMQRSVARQYLHWLRRQQRAKQSSSSNATAEMRN
jgi:hypothetical protein